MKDKKIDLSKATKKDMIKHGLLEIFGTHEDGSEMFRFTDKFIDEYPEYFNIGSPTDDEVMRSLWFKGFISITLDENSDIYFSFTEKTQEWMDSTELTEIEKEMMHDIILYSTLLSEGE
ncbi:hypothetical protein EBR43_14220 [bacterium]|nr:hypothetical protein [bacterium]